MSALRARLTTLKTRTGHRDPVRLRYIESLLLRARDRGDRLGARLEARAAAAMDAYEAQGARPDRARPDRARPDRNRHLRELNRALEALRRGEDDPGMPALESALRQQELELVESLAAQASAPGQNPAARAEELRAAHRFHAAMVVLNADKVVNQALEEVPREAGPLNPQRLATHSLVSMRDLSPHYLSRFVSYIDTLFWLERADSRLKR